MKDQAERKNREIDGRWLRSGIAEQVPVRNHYEEWDRACQVVKGSPVIARSAEWHLLRSAS